MSYTSVKALAQLRNEFHGELSAIVDWWLSHSMDFTYGGFYGEVDANNKPVKDATKGIILHARILWFFSEAAAIFYAESNPKSKACASAATRAYDYILQNFFDAEHGGFYWELDAKGTPLNTKKQTYAQAFAIYALTAYYSLTQEPQVLAHALNCFHLVEANTRDAKYGGYLEAFTRDWGKIDDLRLSEKDLNFPKSQNTHLHILEAYTTLNKIYPAPNIGAALRYNIDIFDAHIIDKHTHHLRMFMDADWTDHSPAYTYGHDIEASWLIAKALESLGDDLLQKELMPCLVKITETTLNEGVGEDGQVLDSFDFASQTQLKDAVWWVQAEALVGFLFAYAESHDPKYFSAAQNIWAFIQAHQIDRRNGEWHWLSTANLQPAPENYKLGFWKCPYHNGRAMMEAINYLEKIQSVLTNTSSSFA